MQDGWSYIKDTGDFFKKIKRFGKITQGAILVTADVVGLHHETDIWKAPNEEIILMAEVFLKNNYFKLKKKNCKQRSGTAI